MRISGVVSISKFPRGNLNSTLGRVRPLRGSPDVQTAQSQPRTGTPLEVPLPRNTRRRDAVAVAAISNKLGPSRCLALRFRLPPLLLLIVRAPVTACDLKFGRGEPVAMPPPGR